jgi:hypothetical protein
LDFYTLDICSLSDDFDMNFKVLQLRVMIVHLGCMCISFIHVVCSLANKQDREGALDELDIVERLNVEAVVNQHRCPTLVEMCSATAVKNSHRKLDPAIHNGFK